MSLSMKVFRQLGESYPMRLIFGEGAKNKMRVNAGALSCGLPPLRSPVEQQRFSPKIIRRFFNLFIDKRNMKKIALALSVAKSVEVSELD